MIETHRTPALPWGTGGADGISRASTADPLPDPATATSNPCGQVPLPEVGSHIEVKWQIEDEDKIESLWWKAHVQAIEPVSSETRAPLAAVLRYQAFRDFEEETADVIFVADGHLYHTDNDETLLQWRKEGEQQSDNDDGADDDGSQLVDANDLDEDEQLIERELGVNAEDVMRQQLQQYPVDQQRQLASGARAFVDHFREQLSQLAQAQGGSGYTVTESDVHGIFASLKQR
ncbi:hypothetical protein WJX77_008090 [Trebouxia sp. C0004]